MNAKRRKALQVIISNLQELDDTKQEIVEMLEEVKEQEQEALDNMPDSLQDSERGQQIEDNVTNLEYAVDFVDEWDVEEITDLLQTVIDA